MLLSALPVALLSLVVVWFVWPLIVDPITQRLADRSDTDEVADDLFKTMSKHGRGTAIMISTDQS